MCSYPCQHSHVVFITENRVSCLVTKTPKDSNNNDIGDVTGGRQQLDDRGLALIMRYLTVPLVGMRGE